jgi:hypothetical protein
MTLVEIRECYPFDMISTRRTNSGMPYHVILQMNHDNYRGFRKALHEKYGIDYQCHISKTTGVATLNFRDETDFTELLLIV